MTRPFLSLLITFWDIEKIIMFRGPQNRARNIGNRCRILDLSFYPPLAAMEARKVAQYFSEKYQIQSIYGRTSLIWEQAEYNVFLH